MVSGFFFARILTRFWHFDVPADTHCFGLFRLISAVVGCLWLPKVARPLASQRRSRRVLHPHPYNSFGNGAAIRRSPAGMIASSLEEAEDLGQRTVEVTHNHPEGIKAAAASMARQADRQRPTTSVRIL